MRVSKNGHQEGMMRIGDFFRKYDAVRVDGIPARQQEAYVRATWATRDERRAQAEAAVACCEWCSEPETTAGELVEYDDGLGEGTSWICQRCFDGARRFDVPGIDY